MKKVIILILVGFAVILVSCQKQSGIIPNEPVKTKTMSDLQIPTTFNWKTTQTIQLTLTTKANNLVNVTSSNGVSYQKAFLKTGVPYTMKLVIPSYEKSLILNFMGKTVSLSISSNNMSYQF